MAVDHAARCPGPSHAAAAAVAAAHGSACELVSFPARSKGSALDEQNQVAGAAGV